MEELFAALMEDFEMETRDAERMQRETLERILEENEETEYLKRFLLKGRRDEETFRKCVPLACHEDFQPYIQRIADGDASPILAAEPFTALSWSSGTTSGKPKLVPFNGALSRQFIQGLSTAMAYGAREFSVKDGRCLDFSLYSTSRHKTKGGLDVGPGSSHLINHLMSSDQKTPTDRGELIMNTSSGKLGPCSPVQVATACDCNQALYCHLLCGLLYSDQIQFIRANFCHQVVQAFRTFESKWKELCADIRQGVLSTERVSDPLVRESVSKLLVKPNPDLADAVYQKCEALESRNWSGLVPTLWPRAKFVTAISTGSMSAYVGKLRHYVGGQLPLVSPVYLASEGMIRLNARPRSGVESTAYAVCPRSAYFEFVPLMKQRAAVEGYTDQELLSAQTQLSDEVFYTESEPVRLADVRVGEIYEVVVTNFAGLYRYRLGDLVKVSRFYNSTPELQFLRRKNVVLNIRTEKTTEIDLQLAVERASKLLFSKEDDKVDIVDFTSYADLSIEPGHYVMLWELIGHLPCKETLQKCCNCLDRSFANVAYINHRKNKFIGALELRIVANGTFTKIREHYQTVGSSVGQFKPPRCIPSSNTPVLKILEDNIIANCFSVAYD